MQDQQFYAVLAHLSDFYDLQLNDNVFENIALHAWDHIGNKDSRLYRYETHIEDHKVVLPCNIQEIEGVFTHEPDWRMPDNVSRYNYGNYDTELHLAHRHYNMEPFYEGGKLIPYEREGNILHFKHNNHRLTVLYKGVFVDEKGLPYLNFKEVDAIAKYVAYVELQKKGMSTKDQGSLQLAQLLNQQWKVAVDDARSPIILNQNDVNRILDVQTSWDRKRFGLSLKPIR